MRPACWISFGPDLEPLELESRRRAQAPEPRADALLVAGDAGEVAAALADAGSSGAGWCRLDRLSGDGAVEAVHVQARHVRFVTPAGAEDADGATRR